MSSESAFADNAPPPPYSEVPGLNDINGENETSAAGLSQREEFLRKARSFRKSYEAEALRVFLLALLKIDYNVPQMEEEEDAGLSFARYYEQFALLYRNTIRPASGVTQPCGEMRYFLENIADLLNTLGLQVVHVEAMLRQYQSLTKGGKLYQSAIDALDIDTLPHKLWRDRTHLIDVLVSQDNPLLRAQLHSALQAIQTRLFDFVQSPSDFRLSSVGEARKKAESSWRAAQEKVVAKERKVAAKRERQSNWRHSCVAS